MLCFKTVIETQNEKIIPTLYALHIKSIYLLVPTKCEANVTEKKIPPHVPFNTQTGIMLSLTLLIISFCMSRLEIKIGVPLQD